MAFVCGSISNFGKANGTNSKRNAVAAVSGGLADWLLYIGESIIKLMIEGSAFVPAVAATAPKMATSGINQIIAVVGSLILIVPLNKALKKYLPKFIADNSNETAD